MAEAAEIPFAADDPWQYLSAEHIEISDYDYYGNGRDLLISIGFLTPWTEDYGLQMHIKNGDTFEEWGTE